MRFLAFGFALMIIALQYPMWLGKGGWLSVRELDRQLAAQRDANASLKARNDALDADVGDLKTGHEAIEERARAELGMVRGDEVLFQVQPAGSRTALPAPPVTAKPQTPAAAKPQTPVTAKPQTPAQTPR